MKVLMMKINIHQLKRLLEEEKRDMDSTNRKAVIEAVLKRQYDPTPTTESHIKFEYATLTYPRIDGVGPSEQEGEELKNVGSDGWECIGFQVYSISDKGNKLIQVAEYLFKRRIV
jgi:hypothetical protein